MKYIYIALLISTIMIPFASALNTSSTCEFEWKDDDIADGVNISVFESENKICLVEIKAARPTYTFTEDGCDSGYCVTGIGTKSGVATVDETFKHDISNVSWYTEQSCTAARIVRFRPLSFLERLFRRH